MSKQVDKEGTRFHSEDDKYQEKEEKFSLESIKGGDYLNHSSDEDDEDEEDEDSKRKREELAEKYK